MKINFDALEARLKSLVESSTQLVSTRTGEDTRTTRLAAALHDFSQEPGDELPEAFVCIVAEKNKPEWKDFNFKKSMQTILESSGKTVATIPQITLQTDPELLDGEIILREVVRLEQRLDKTASMPTLTPEEDDFLGDGIPDNAFIIVNGLDTIQLTQSVVNIGRRLENDVVIEDPRISRDHAQIRVVKGQYVIFDLNSTGGTFVNSVRVAQQPLFPGDVISLAGVPIVYGQDSPPPHAQTGPVEPFFDPSDPKGKS